jgi:metallophosphoesterase (TIGR03767 family)
MTHRPTIRPGVAGPGGYRRLSPGPAEPHRSRSDLAPPPDVLGEPLLTMVQLSDLHVCDAQSPARAEFLNRWADPDCPARGRLGEVGTYRPQEALTTQVVEAMVRTINSITYGPVGMAPLELAITTGDNTDNAQANELSWYLGLLNGGMIRPDSGDYGRYEGVADGVVFDERFWQPTTLQRDLPRSQFGFPQVPGLLDAARAPFTAVGLCMPWLAVHGNHDRMLQGTLPATGALARAATGSRKPIALAPGWSTDAAVKLIEGLADCDPAAIAALGEAVTREVTADPARRIVSRAEFVAAHFGPGDHPNGHGFEHANRTTGNAYYRYEFGRITLLVLDTVNEHGGWQGSIDEEQFAWADAQLASADADHRHVVLASHHPLHTLINDRVPDDGSRRVLAAEIAAMLDRHPCVVLWLNGHTHRTTVLPHSRRWEVTTPSLIDWPQQGRVIEVLRSSTGVLTIAATMINHAGPATWGGAIDSPLALAGLSRELAANDWQSRHYPIDEHPRAGRQDDRNVLLHLPDPWA